MIKGTWQIIQWCPDLVTREMLNIGVGFTTGDFQQFKFLDDFEKIGQVYGLDTVSHLKAVLELTRKLFGEKAYDFSPQIRVIDVGFSQGESIDEVLNRSYDRVVTFRGDR